MLLSMPSTSLAVSESECREGYEGMLCDSPSTSSTSVPVAAIVGAVVGGTVCLIVIFVIIVVVIRRCYWKSTRVYEIRKLTKLHLQNLIFVN